MSLTDQIVTDLKQAMKNRDKMTLSTVRMIKAALMNAKIKLGRELTPKDELDVLTSEVKQRKESIEEFQKAGRDDLVKQTQAELTIVMKYMPEPLSESNLTKLITEAIEKSGAKTKTDFGKVMKLIMPKVKGRADGKAVSKMVNQALNK